ncbi:MAG TPA: phosphocholine cytidylyltransferase family protein [Acidimicrobiales bacterium]|nr:phosphocholine cytidylyltransferase family protein [Acidimicrobiales bacterium]
MKGLILAAGRGSRMASLTSDRPKGLVEIDGRTLLDRQLSALNRAGVTEIAVVGGWQFDGLRSLGLPLYLNAEWETTTMVDSLLSAHEWFDGEPVFVSYADIVFGSDVVRTMMERDDELIIAYDEHWLEKWTLRFEDPLTDAETFTLTPDAYLKTIGRRATDLADIQGQYMGLLLLRPAALEKIRAVAESNEIFSMTHLLEHLVENDVCAVKCVPTPDPWFEFDTISDIEWGTQYLRQLDAIERSIVDAEEPVAKS